MTTVVADQMWTADQCLTHLMWKADLYLPCLASLSIRRLFRYRSYAMLNLSLGALGHMGRNAA